MPFLEPSEAHCCNEDMSLTCWIRLLSSHHVPFEMIFWPLKHEQVYSLCHKHRIYRFHMRWLVEEHLWLSELTTLSISLFFPPLSRRACWAHFLWSSLHHNLSRTWGIWKIDTQDESWSTLVDLHDELRSSASLSLIDILRLMPRQAPASVPESW